MFFSLAIQMNTIIFWGLLALVTLLISGVSIHYLVSNRRLFQRLNQSMLNASDDIRNLDRCDIANLPWVRETLDDPDFPLLGSAAEQMVEDSERLYQGKWIANPSRLFQLDNLLTRKEFTLISQEVPARVLAVSLLASALFWLLGSIIFDSRSLSVLLPASLPLIIGFGFAAMMALSNDRTRRELSRSGQYLADLLMRRLPVFEELAGTAVLIDSFVRYDREMSESVAFLSETVERLVHNELADSISENVRVVMQEDIAPSYQQAAAVLVDLASTITERQEAGMHELATDFSKNLSRTLADDLTALFQEMRVLTERFQASSNDVDMSLQALSDAAMLQQNLQERSTLVLEQLATEREQWNQEITTVRESLAQMSDMTSNLTELYSGESMNLGNRMGTLSEELSAFSVSIHEVLGGLARENHTLRSSMTELDQHGTRLLEDLRQLSLEMGQQSSNLARQSAQVNENLADLNMNLNESVRQFSVQLQSSVETTLNDFDESLGEVSMRLANTTGEIRDSLRQQQTTLRRAHDEATSEATGGADINRV